MEDLPSTPSAPGSTAPSRASKTMKPSAEARQQFLSKLKIIQPSSVVFSSREPLPCTLPVDSQVVIRKLPHPLSSLHKCEFELLNEEELATVCRRKFSEGVITMTSDEAAYLEESTKLQAQSLLWHKQRIGRITASKFFSVARASLDPPPASLVKEIMERSSKSAYNIPALQWGIKNEDTAREAYIDIVSEEHENFVSIPAGLHVDLSYPHLGASPDGLINCDCCGKGLIEVKCPYKYRDVDPCTVTDPSFYLKMSDNGCLQLGRNHAYYHQIQGQLAICKREYCDFICWTQKGMYTERILLEPTYLSKIKPSLDTFFIKVVLPLLLTGRVTSRKIQSVSQTQSQMESTDTLQSISATSSASTCNPVNSESQSQTYCWCGGKDIGRMIACDNTSCSLEWFHYDCVGIKRKPRGKWFCSDACKTSYLTV